MQVQRSANSSEIIKHELDGRGRAVQPPFTSVSMVLSALHSGGLPWEGIIKAKPAAPVFPTHPTYHEMNDRKP